MSWKYYPKEFSFYEEYVKYLKEKRLAVEVTEENNFYKEKVMTNEEKIKEIGEWMEFSPCTPSQAAMMGAEEMADFKDRQYLALLNTLIKSGADPQIVYDFIIINDIDVDQIIL